MERKTNVVVTTCNYRKKTRKKKQNVAVTTCNYWKKKQIVELTTSNYHLLKK